MHEAYWEPLRQQVIAQFRLGSQSAHCWEHWDRVQKYGDFLARHNGADPLVVRLFALLHDSRRQREGPEPEHGPRAAQYAQDLCGTAFQLASSSLELLMFACYHHEAGQTSQDPTIGACWDADRLDLDRVGINTDPDLMSTAMGRILSQKRPLDRQKWVGI